MGSCCKPAHNLMAVSKWRARTPPGVLGTNRRKTHSSPEYEKARPAEYGWKCDSRYKQEAKNCPKDRSKKRRREEA